MCFSLQIANSLVCLLTTFTTSSSAERAMSRVRLIKNHLRTTMMDDWFSSLMVLAAEKDILDSIPVDRIIDQFANLSTPLQKLLVNWSNRFVNMLCTVICKCNDWRSLRWCQILELLIALMHTAHFKSDLTLSCFKLSLHASALFYLSSSEHCKIY